MNLVPAGVPGPRGSYLVLGGIYLVPGGVPGPGGTCLGTPPCEQTHTCKNITFATSFRTVITGCPYKVGRGYTVMFENVTPKDRERISISKVLILSQPRNSNSTEKLKIQLPNNLIKLCVTAAGWRAGNTRLNFVRPGSNPVGARAGLLQQPGLLR